MKDAKDRKDKKHEMKFSVPGWFWVFKTPLKDWFNYFKNRLFTSKYVVKGKCKECGNCCRNILFSGKDGYIRTVEQFEKVKKQSPRMRHFFVSGELNNAGEVALLFTCKSIGDDNRCRHYFFRSPYCRKYPIVDKNFIAQGGEMLDGCGFYFDVDKKFKEYLKT